VDKWWKLLLRVREVKISNSPTTHLWRCRWERRYRSYSFLTLLLDGVSGQRHSPVALYLREKNPRYPQEGWWAPEPVWTQTLEEKSSCLCWESNLDRPVVQFAAKHYTVWATPAPIREVPSSNFSPKTGYPDWGSLWLFSVPPVKSRVRILNQATAASFHILYYSLFTYHPFIRRYFPLSYWKSVVK
jgi:hypothetical protein